MSKKNINRCKFLNSSGICASPINKNQIQCSKIPINLCYFKQCQEKDKRILVLVNKNNRLEEKLNQTNLLLEGKINQYDTKKFEYQALMQTFRFEVGCKDIIQRERDRYKQALDKIEKYQQRNCKVCVFANTQKCNINCQVFVILNIIHKSKEK